MEERGSCQCGFVKYQVSGDSLGLVLCYCTECQKLSTGIATYGMALKSSSFKVLEGTLVQWERSTYSGGRHIANFCPKCGGRIYHQDPDIPEIIRLKAGTLESANQLVPDAHVWLSSAAP